MIHSAIPDSQQPISPIGFLFLKLPPPPCAVLLVMIKKIIKGSLGGETSVLRTFRMSGKELVKERVSQGKVS